MPCYDGREPEILVAQLNKKINDLTRLLCNTGKDAEELGYISQMRGDFLQWWKEHKENDARNERERMEMERRKQLRDQAISRLTPEEVDALRELGTGTTDR